MSYLTNLINNERDSWDEMRRQEIDTPRDYCIFCGGYEGIDEFGNECEECQTRQEEE